MKSTCGGIKLDFRIKRNEGISINNLTRCKKFKISQNEKHLIQNLTRCQIFISGSDNAKINVIQKLTYCEVFGSQSEIQICFSGSSKKIVILKEEYEKFATCLFIGETCLCVGFFIILGLVMSVIVFSFALPLQFLELLSSKKRYS